MKVLDMVQELRRTLENATVDATNRAVMEIQLIRLEVEIAEALQAAEQEEYLNGYKDGYSGGYEDGAGYRQ